MFPISSAPRDGTKIYAWDGEWWRLARWHPGGAPLESLPGWYFQRYLMIRPTHWHPVKDAPQKVIDNALKGISPVSVFEFTKLFGAG